MIEAHTSAGMSMVEPGEPERLGSRLAFETLLADLSSRFINLAPHDVGTEIDDAQRRICDHLGLELSSLWQWSPDATGMLTLTHLYRVVDGPPPPSPMAAAEYFPWIQEQLLAGRTVEFTSMTDLPPEAGRDAETLAHFGVKSGLIIPLGVGADLAIGTITFATVRTERAWPESLVRRLQLVAQVFANALARGRADETRRRDQARLAAGAELTGLAFYEVDLENGSMYVDDRLREVCGVPATATRGLEPLEFWLAHVHPDDRERVLDLRRQMHEGAIDRLSIEYRYQHPERGERWIDHLAAAVERGATGHARRTFGVLRDVTARGQAAEALRRSYAEIERLRDQLQAETDYLRAEINVTHARGEFTGQSAAILAITRQVAQVASTDSTVLVRGETGTGKELVADAIHRLSPRRSRLMVKVNCAALPTGLVESELFGRERGAYTGALTRQAGRFEAADGSTLFLDEIGELSLDVQAKLLRVLEQGEFERLGSPKTIKVNVRLIAATNRDLVQAIQDGRFREDLYYRLNIFPIQVPPLRERPEDVPQLVWQFLGEFTSRMGKKITQVPRRTMEALQRHAWPGNVRQLRNAIEHAVIISAGETLVLPALDNGASRSPALTLIDVERDHILHTLERTGWHIKGPQGAAAALGLNPATLYSRMKKLGIELRRASPPPDQGR